MYNESCYAASRSCSDDIVQAHVLCGKGLSVMSNVKMSRNPKDVKKVSTICHVPKDVTMDTIT